jgi:GT2 family glycosyltransferase
MKQGGEMRGISVVVPTRGDVESLTRLVHGLQAAGERLAGRAAVECILVDDTPPPDHRKVSSLCERTGVRYLPGPRSVAAKRNIGAREAQHELILFTDSDCIPLPDLLTAHLDRWSQERSAAFAAFAGPTILEGTAHTWAWKVAEESEVFAPSAWGFPNVDSVVAPWLWPLRFSEIPWAATSNLVVIRSAFEAIGGFDEESFTVVGGEDVDFCARLRQAGYRIGCAPSATVLHARNTGATLRSMLSKEFLYGRSCVYNCARHPNETVAHANPIAVGGVLTAAALVRRSPRLLGATLGVLAGWWVADARRHPRGGRLSRRRFAAVSLEWAFRAGIVVEAMKRGMPGQLMRRYDYFSPAQFVAAVEDPGTMAP